jgi:hypothetical protein
MRAAGATPVARHARTSVHLDAPLDELALEIGAIVETAHLEEAPLHEPDQVLDAPYLLCPRRSA